jgi:outer membrane protein assembly factor BamB
MRLRFPALILLFAAALQGAPAWSRFRGPNGTGVAETGRLPEAFGKTSNQIWRTALSPGYSSPVAGDRCIFLTSYDGPKEALRGYTHCIDKKTGAEVWKQQGFELKKKFISVNTPVSPTPVTDGSTVYVFFEAAGMIAYATDGKELWRRELGTFNNPYGMANSPVLAGGLLILQADQDTGSYLLAMSVKDGSTVWRVERPHAQHGYSSPSLYRPKKGPEQLIVSESYQVTGYELKTGKRLWWVNGMAWQAKSVPVIDGDTLYLHSWMAELSELVKLPRGLSWEQFLAEYDKDKDGKIAKPEAPDQEMTRLWFLFDIDRSGTLEKSDYDIVQSRTTAKSGFFAIQLGGLGDITDKAILWKAEKSLPNIPSPVFYRGVLYILKEGGILTAYNPKNGEVLKQGRIEGALGGYFASLVGSDGKIFAASQEGQVAVVQASGDWQVLKVNDLGEEIWATPAIDSGKLYVRTQQALYCFGLTAN